MCQVVTVKMFRRLKHMLTLIRETQEQMRSEGHTECERDRERNGERERARERERQRQTERARQTDRQRDRDRHTHTHRQRKREEDRRARARASTCTRTHTRMHTHLKLTRSACLLDGCRRAGFGSLQVLHLFANKKKEFTVIARKLSAAEQQLQDQRHLEYLAKQQQKQ